MSISTLFEQRSPEVENSPAGSPRRARGLYVLDGPSLNLIYSEDQQREIAELVDIVAAPQTRESLRENLSLLADVDIIFSGWGAPVMDAAFLKNAPHLKAVFYGSGSIRPFTTEAFWDRNITVTSAYAANAQPVAEYTLAAILLSLKHFWRYAQAAKRGEGWGDHTRPMVGAFQSVVGMVSSGMIARRVLQLLSPFDLRTLMACPFLSPAEARDIGAELCPLDEVFRQSDVVSLHTPDLPATWGMITGAHFASMKQNATFINSARGRVVREQEMIEVLRARPDLTVVLDVTSPEPPSPDSPLLTLPNVVLTPHIAGSMGGEIQRLGLYMVQELRRYLLGQPLQWQITRESAAKLA